MDALEVMGVLAVLAVLLLRPIRLMTAIVRPMVLIVLGPLMTCGRLASSPWTPT